MEKLGLGPEECMARNQRLVYGRMTGWGQTGPLSQAAGHDINYISLTGSLAAIGRSGEKPVPPLNLVGDFGGGGMFLAYGMVCALLEAQKSGTGQVIDAAMTDGSALLMTMIHSFDAQGMWSPQRESNLLDGGAHFYDVYETRDGKYISIGPIEPQFYALLVEIAGLDANDFRGQNDAGRWPELKRKLETVFKTRSRDEWCELMEGSEVCFAPVLDIHEAPLHRHNRARETYIEIGGMTQPAPAPRFSRTTPEVAFAPHEPGADTGEVLKEWGVVSRT
jgi:alpha-methylacyl-CoA racemase